MARTPVVSVITALLDNAPTSEASGFPAAYSHHDLAAEVYGTTSPTAAQLSAVRRAVAKLVTAGRAERDHERWGRGAGVHERRRVVAQDTEQEDVVVGLYANPGGVGVRRAMTAADHAARAAAMARLDLQANEQIIERNR